MRQLQAAERQQGKQKKELQKDNRLKKQELQREHCERQLMICEDYVNTAEGTRRVRAYEERLQM